MTRIYAAQSVLLKLAARSSEPTSIGPEPYPRRHKCGHFAPAPNARLQSVDYRHVAAPVFWIVVCARERDAFGGALAHTLVGLPQGLLNF